MTIKVSDYIADFIEKLGVRDVFLISGGGNMHLIDALGRHKNLRYYCTHHEQSAAMAAEAYAKIKESFGVCIVTSGPAGTNAITGLAGAWLDSTPVLILSGQVKTSNLIPFSGLRQFGVQELPIVDIVKPITKYAAIIRDAKRIRYKLEKAVYLSREGRPGPVWMDIPLDIQGAYIDPARLESFKKPEEKKDTKKLKNIVNKVTAKLLKSKRPVLYAGAGIRISGACEDFLKLIDFLNIPVLTGWNANDLISSDHPLFMGRPGTFGQRHSNFIIQNADFILSVGARLSIPQIGYEFDQFAPHAYKIAVDIDHHELKKPSLKNFDLKIAADAGEFISELIKQVILWGKRNTWWLNYCNKLKNKYPVVLPEYKKQKKYVNSYFFIDALSKLLNEKSIVITDMGTSFTCTAQTFNVKRNQRYFTSSGLASMGFGLPGAIGAQTAASDRQTICIVGDGALQMNIQELQTVIHYNLPIKIFVLNNGGYLTIRETQKNYFAGRFVGSDAVSGLSCPDTIKIAKAYGFKTQRIKNQKNLSSKIKKILNQKGPFVCEIMMDPDQPLIPKTASKIDKDGHLVSQPLENLYPFLPRREFLDNMIVKPL